MRWGQRSAARRIQQLDCPWCDKPFSDITTNDLVPRGVRMRLTANTRVHWDRRPKRRVVCKSYNVAMCFDGEFRPTACDMSDAITRVQRQRQN